MSTVDLDALGAELIAERTGAAVDAFVTLECNAYKIATYTETPIANVTWTQGGTFLSVTQDNKINVTSDTPGMVNFTCTVIDDYGRNATANVTVDFYEETVLEGEHFISITLDNSIQKSFSCRYLKTHFDNFISWCLS